MRAKGFLLCSMAILLILLAACTGQSEPSEEEIATAIAGTQQIQEALAFVETATEAAKGPTATSTLNSTSTPAGTDTPQPTPSPQWQPVDIADVESALSKAGHRRHPFTTDDGRSAFIWVYENNYLRVTTFEDWVIEIQILHDASDVVRSKAMEKKFKVLDQAFPAGFMEELRDENARYNARIGAKVSGEPDEVQAFNDDWNTVWAEYNAEETRIGSYNVRFSLWFWQSTCPPGYFCWYEDFPGLEFLGDSSFTFYTILLVPSDEVSLSNPNL